MSSQHVPSAALLAANKRLHQLRTEFLPHAEENQFDPRYNQRSTAKFDCITDCPEHLGWDSGAVTAVIRDQHSLSPQSISGESSYPPKHSISESSNSSLHQPTRENWVKVYPAVAVGMLRQEQAAAGRLWLLLRHLDVEGRGVLRVVSLRQALTQPKSPMRLCGWRQLRNLLRQGEGVFWQRDKQRVWLRSAGKVAATLGVMKLNGRPVAIPVKHLLGTIGEARAYLYASFHAGRQPVAEQRSGQKPIARETLTALTGLTAECQRGYEQRVGIRVNRNYVVGEHDSNSNKEERLWQQGSAAFDFVDYRGGQGKPGRGYIAWQLPNSYSVALAHRPKGRQKRINRMLSDLFMQGMTGNEQQRIEKRYYGDGAGAARAVARMARHKRSEAEVFWLQRGRENGRLRLWQVMST